MRWFQLCIIFSQASLIIPSQPFFCNQFYDTAAQTLKSIRNDSIRLTVLNSSTSLTFDQASQVCKRCWDGNLVTNDDVTQLQSYLPLWIGLASGQSTRRANLEDLIWLDGSKLNQWQKGYAQSILLSESFESNIGYGVYAFPGDWEYEVNYDRYRHEYDPFNRRRYENKVVVQSGVDAKMKWIVLPRNELISNYPVSSSGYKGLSEAEADGLGKKSMKYVVCERPVRPKCHFWNYTEHVCLMSKVFGCHSYENAMFHRGDDFVSCDPPPRRRYAIPCPCSNCTCHVTEWSQWSSCGSEVCSQDAQTRTRIRKEIDPACPTTYIHMALEETQNCTVPGCDELMASAASCLNLEERNSALHSNNTLVDKNE